MKRICNIDHYFVLVSSLAKKFCSSKNLFFFPLSLVLIGISACNRPEEQTVSSFMMKEKMAASADILKNKTITAKLEDYSIVYSRNLCNPKCKITLSSSIDTVPNSSVMCDGIPTSYWHVSVDELYKPAWVSIDLGRGNKEAVNFIRIIQRQDATNQMFSNAQFEGSNDGGDWVIVAGLRLDYFPERNKWITWEFTNNTTYRFYRLYIEEKDKIFYSFAEFQMYRLESIE